MCPLNRSRAEIARYYTADLFQDRRDFIRGRPNYVGGREDWIERSLQLRGEEEVQQAIEETNMTRFREFYAGRARGRGRGRGRNWGRGFDNQDGSDNHNSQPRGHRDWEFDEREGRSSHNIRSRGDGDSRNQNEFRNNSESRPSNNEREVRNTRSNQDGRQIRRGRGDGTPVEGIERLVW